MVSDFPVLSSIAKALKVVGWLGVAVALCSVGYGILEPMQPNHAFGIDDIAAIGLGYLVLLLGLITCAAAEAIGVLLAIEENTWNSAISARAAAGTTADGPER